MNEGQEIQLRNRVLGILANAGLSRDTRIKAADDIVKAVKIVMAR